MASLDFKSVDYEFFCEVCDTHVLKNTKHCQRCNRCSAEFDHHCVWVSNDIGLHNYIDFMRMLTAVLFTFIFQIAFCVYTLCELSDIPDETEIAFGASRGDLNILTWVTLIVTAILLLLDTYLILFHFFLICKNTSTYKHIRRQRNNKKSLRVIVEVGKRENQVGVAQSINDSMINANSFSLNTSLEKQKKPKRVTFKDIYCCGPKSNELLVPDKKILVRSFSPGTQKIKPFSTTAISG